MRLVAVYLCAGLLLCSGFKTAIPQDSLIVVPDSIAHTEPLHPALKNDLLRQVQHIMPTINKLLRNHSQKLHDLRAVRLLEAMRQAANRSKTARSPDEVLKFVGQAVQDAGVADEVAQLAHDLDVGGMYEPNPDGGVDSALVGVTKAGVWPFVYDWPNFHPRTSFNLDDRLKTWGTQKVKKISTDTDGRIVEVEEERKLEYLPNAVPKLVFGISYFLNIIKRQGELRFKPCWAVGTGAMMSDVTGAEFGGDDLTVSLSNSANVPGWSWTPFDLNFNIRGVVFAKYGAQDDGGAMGRYEKGESVVAVMTANPPGFQYARCYKRIREGVIKKKKIRGDFPAIILKKVIRRGPPRRRLYQIQPNFPNSADDRNNYKCFLSKDQLDANVKDGNIVVATTGFKSIDKPQYRVAIARDDIGIVLRKCEKQGCYDALIAFDGKGAHWVSVYDFKNLLKTPQNHKYLYARDMFETAVSSTSVALEFTSTNKFVAVNFGMCISGKTQGGLCQSKEDTLAEIMGRLEEMFPAEKRGSGVWDEKWYERRSDRRDALYRDLSQPLAPRKVAVGAVATDRDYEHTDEQWKGIIFRKLLRFAKRVTYEFDIEHTWCDCCWSSFKASNW